MIKEGFVLRKMPGMNLVMPTGVLVKEYSGAVMLNDTGAFIFEKLNEKKTAEEVAECLTEEYNIALDNATESVKKTIKQLDEAGLITAG